MVQGFDSHTGQAAPHNSVTPRKSERCSQDGFRVYSVSGWPKSGKPAKISGCIELHDGEKGTLLFWGPADPSTISSPRVKATRCTLKCSTLFERRARLFFRRGSYRVSILRCILKANLGCPASQSRFQNTFSVELGHSFSLNPTP